MTGVVLGDGTRDGPSRWLRRIEHNFLKESSPSSTVYKAPLKHEVACAVVSTVSTSC